MDYTKGKWELTINDYGHPTSINGEHSICTIRTNNQQEALANASIIVNAPEMYEMLKLYSILNENHYKDIAGFIIKSREIIKNIENGI